MRLRIAPEPSFLWNPLRPLRSLREVIFRFFSRAIAMSVRFAEPIGGPIHERCPERRASRKGREGRKGLPFSTSNDPGTGDRRQYVLSLAFFVGEITKGGRRREEGLDFLRVLCALLFKSTIVCQKQREGLNRRSRRSQRKGIGVRAFFLCDLGALELGVRQKSFTNPVICPPFVCHTNENRRRRQWPSRSNSACRTAKRPHLPFEGLADEWGHE
jgi:hypothetical protein